MAADDRDPTVHLDDFPDALIALSVEGGVREWNRGAERVFGWAAAEAVGRSLTELIVPPGYAEEADRLAREAVESGPVHYQTIRRRKDGALVHVDVAMAAVRDSRGRIHGLAAVKRDITRMKTLHEARQLEGRFGRLLEAAPDAMALVSREGYIVLVNSQLEHLFGWSREALLGQPIETLVPERLREAHPRHRAAYAAEPRPRPMGASLDLLARRADGSEFPVEISLSPMETEEGPVTIAAVRDITARRNVEARFRGLLEAAPDPMVIVGGDGRIALVNSRAEQVFGYGRAELLGQPVEILVPERFHGAHLGHRAAYGADPHPRPMGRDLELYARRRDGGEIPVEISLSPLETEEGTLVTAAVRDISERKKLEQRRREADEAAMGEALAASRLKSEFLANMSHELRTPLNAVTGFAQLLADGKAGPLTATQAEFVADILTSSRHLLRILNDVLDLAKIEAGRMVLRPRPVDPAELVAEVADTLRGLAGERRIAVALDLSPEVERLDLDPDRLKQVLYNYLSNALKFTPEGGRVAVRLRPEGEGEFRVEVEDTGIGIRTEDLPRLFVEFQQLDSGHGKRYPGTGLGLALTRRIAEAQGGRVGVRSVPGRGSVFTVVLPRVAKEVVARDDAPAGDPEPGPAPPADRGLTGRVLVIDDHPANLKLARLVLAGAGHEVETAADAEEAAAVLERFRPRVVLMDIQLPGTSGLELARRLKAGPAGHRVAVLALTAYAMKGDEERALAAGCDDYLAKPIAPARLLDAVARALSRSRA